MSKYQEIRFKPGYIVWIDKEKYSRFQAWYEFCNMNFLKPRGDSFYKEFVEYYDKNRKS